MNFTLEKYKLFPYAAWAIFIGFALFVGALAVELNSETTEIASANQRLSEITMDNSERLDLLEAELDRIAEERNQ
jgi:hypothetical protein